MALLNRYDGPLLTQYYEQILAKAPGYGPLREKATGVLKEFYRPGMRVLDAGAGRGDSSKPFLEAIPELSIDLLDVAPEMLDMADQVLGPYAGRYTKIVEDAQTYFERCGPYDIIISEFTVHNFPQEEKKVFLAAAHKALRAGGFLLLIDKIQPDDAAERKALFDVQMARYRDQSVEEPLLSEVAEAIVAHEAEDHSDEFLMTETKTLELLREAGYRDARVEMRIERDAIVSAWA